MLSPLLCSLFTHDCIPVYGSNTIIKFADDITVICLIKDDDESAYTDEVEHLAVWCAANNLELNTQKTKEIIVDFRRARNHAHTPPSTSMELWQRAWLVSNSLASTFLKISPGL